jgi:hypothetical protein
MLVVEGGREAIDRVFWSKEWKILVAQASALVQDVQLDLAVGGALGSLAGPVRLYAGAVRAIAGS